MTMADVTNRAASDLDNIDFDQMCVQTSFAVNDKTLVNCDKATAGKSLPVPLALWSTR